MSMQDPISDMLTIIRNGYISNKKKVFFYFSKKRFYICKVLFEEGYLLSLSCVYKRNKKNKFIQIYLKYYKNISAIEKIKRVSRPGLRVYKSFKDIPRIYGGFGISIISTSKGVLSDKNARIKKMGGEVICYVV